MEKKRLLELAGIIQLDEAAKPLTKDWFSPGKFVFTFYDKSKKEFGYFDNGTTPLTGDMPMKSALGSSKSEIESLFKKQKELGMKRIKKEQDTKLHGRSSRTHSYDRLRYELWKEAEKNWVVVKIGTEFV